MKHLFTIIIAAAAALALISCNEDNKQKNQILDPLAKISIRADIDKAFAAPTRADYPTPLEVVQKTTDIVLQNAAYPNDPYLNVGVSEDQKDITTPKIMMWGMWVVLDGQLNMNFIEAYDVVIVTRQNQDRTKPISDTLAYIPNAQLRVAEVAIKAAYEAKEYDEVYRLFDQAYRFTPINGAGWLKLKEKGEN